LLHGFGVPEKYVYWMNPDNPNDFLPMSETEKQEFIREVSMYTKSLPDKDEVIIFYDETGKEIMFP
jgi:hypothetical protein